MSDQERKPADLEQLLRDERALRIRAETRAAEQTEKVQIWRSRAEERAERIKVLTSERSWTRRRKPAPKPPAPPDPPAVTGERRPARLAAIAVATLVNPEQMPYLDAFAAEPMANGPGVLAEADLVVVDPVALASADPATGRHFDEWLGSPARQPLALIAGEATNPGEGLLSAAGVVLAADSATYDSLNSRGLNVIELAPVFDPAVHNPIGRRWPVPDSPGRGSIDGFPVVTANDDLVGIESVPVSFPADWLIEAAASGVALSNEALDLTDPEALAKAGAAARRWAYRHHTPVTRAAQIAAAAGLGFPDPRPTAAAILVSMRPAQAVRALEMIRSQTYRPLSVVVGLHGESPTPALSRLIEQMEPTIPATLLAFPRELTLGQCLNEAIAATGAEVLAKIDDDDFYGPSHIEDGIQALEYSGAGIVGKGAQFTFVEEQDATVLRRQREQESFIGGSPTGATMLIRRSLWEQTGFPHRPRQVDVLFTRAARRNGTTVYANSRWDFCYIRQAGGHTWTTPSSTFLTGAESLWAGFHPERMVAPSLEEQNR